MKKFIILLIANLIVINFAFSQGAAINTTGNNADNSAMLDVSSTTKGLLIPRMTNSQRNAISNPAEGLQIFNTDTKCFEFYANNVWQTAVCSCNFPSAPTANAGSGATSTSITANWSATTGAAGYYLDVSTDINFGSFVSGYNNLNVGNVTTFNVTGLTSNTTYYYQVRAYNACGTSSNSGTITYSTPFSCGSNLTDSRDGNIYGTVLIGTQCWMKQNLNYGTYVPVANGGQTDNGIPEKYCTNVSGTGNDNSCPYGGLYEFAEAVKYLNGITNTTSWNPVPTGNIQGVCPNGWHIPSDAEWCTMENAIEAGINCNSTGNRGTNIGNKLKTIGNGAPPQWKSPSAGTNTSNFSALPGAGSWYGSFYSVGEQGNWWNATVYDNNSAYYRGLDYNIASISRTCIAKAYGFSIRCIMD